MCLEHKSADFYLTNNNCELEIFYYLMATGLNFAQWSYIIHTLYRVLKEGNGRQVASACAVDLLTHAQNRKRPRLTRYSADIADGTPISMTKLSNSNGHIMLLLTSGCRYDYDLFTVVMAVQLTPS